MRAKKRADKREKTKESKQKREQTKESERKRANKRKQTEESKQKRAHKTTKTPNLFSSFFLSFFRPFLLSSLLPSMLVCFLSLRLSPFRFFSFSATTQKGRMGGGRKRSSRRRRRHFFAFGAFRATSPKHHPGLSCIDKTRLRDTPQISRGNSPSPKEVWSY